MIRRGLVPIAVLLGLASAPAAHGAGEAERPRAAASAWVHEDRGGIKQALAAQARDLEQAMARMERRRQELEHVVTRQRALMDIDRVLETARAKLEETRRQLALADHVVAEPMTSVPPRAEPAAPPPPVRRERPAIVRPRPLALLVRHDGSAGWSLADAPRVERFYRQRFGRALPVSAHGQTPLHDSLGFDHRLGLDVALHPDSREGQALLGFLRQAGLPFIAIRGPIPGEATAAHIHIGPPSARGHVTHVATIAPFTIASR